MVPNILVPFDFGHESERALAWAADLCRGLNGRLRLLNVLQPFPPADVMGPVIPPPPSDADIGRCEAALRAAVGPHQVPADVEVVVAASPGEAILAAAADHGNNLIVMGTHGRGGVRRLMVGSVAEHVLRQASCPVVTVRAPPR